MNCDLCDSTTHDTEACPHKDSPTPLLTRLMRLDPNDQDS